MRRSIVLCLALTLVLSACGGVRDSRLNPLNWFGRDRPAPVAAEEGEVNPLIPQESGLGLFSRNRDGAEYAGQPVDVIRNLDVERVPGGAIVRATGLSRFQNTYSVRLTLVTLDGPVDGALEYRLEAIVPEAPIAGGSERQREVVAAVSLTDQELRGVRVIRVSGVENARASARR